MKKYLYPLIFLALGLAQVASWSKPSRLLNHKKVASSTKKPVSVFSSVRFMTDVPVLKLWNRPLIDDPLQALLSLSEKHQIAYCAYVPVKGEQYWQPFLAIRDLGDKSVEAKGFVLHITKVIVLFTPQFSTDGQYIYLRDGDPYFDAAPYEIVRMNVQTHRIDIGPSKNERVAYNLLYPAPSNRYIAYIRDTDKFGYRAGAGTPALCIFDFSKGTGRLVAENPYLELDQRYGNINWTANNSLLFAATPKTIVASKKTVNGAASDAEAKPVAYPNIYEASAVSGKPVLVIEKGFHPVPSPSGQQIAFLSWINNSSTQANAVKENQSEAPPQVTLNVFDRHSKKSWVLSTRSDCTEIRWTPDGKSLLLLTENQRGDRRTGFLGLIRIPALIPAFPDLGLHPVEKVITQVEVRDYKPLYEESFQPRFRFLGFSSDGRSVFIQTQRYTGINLRMTLLNEVDDIKRISLETSVIENVATVQNPTGLFDWR